MISNFKLLAPAIDFRGLQHADQHRFDCRIFVLKIWWNLKREKVNGVRKKIRSKQKPSLEKKSNQIKNRTEMKSWIHAASQAVCCPLQSWHCVLFYIFLPNKSESSRANLCLFSSSRQSSGFDARQRRFRKLFPFRNSGRRKLEQDTKHQDCRINYIQSTTQKHQPNRSNASIKIRTASLLSSPNDPSLIIQLIRVKQGWWW